MLIFILGVSDDLNFLIDIQTDTNDYVIDIERSKTHC